MAENIEWGEVLKTALTNPGKLSPAYSAFHGYSFGNCMAAMSQCLTRGYMQNWYQGSAVPEKSARRIFSAADKIMKAGQVTAPAVEPA